MSSPPTRSSTVGIPLYRSAPWVDNLIANIQELSHVAQIIVSDDTERDNTLKKLKKEFRNNPQVEFLGKRKLSPGWVAHCNELKVQAKTDFFMWLAHDDSVMRDWIVQGEEALQEKPQAVMALGSLEIFSDHGERQRLLPSPDNEIEEPVERINKALIRQFVTKEPGFGHSFHGLQRNSLTPLLPTTTSKDLGVPAGWKADVFWSIDALSRGTFTVIEACHKKFQHSSSESSDWELENNVAGFRSELLRHLGSFTQAQQLEVATTIWDAEAVRLRQIHENQRKRILRLKKE